MPPRHRCRSPRATGPRPTLLRSCSWCRRPTPRSRRSVCPTCDSTTDTRETTAEYVSIAAMTQNATWITRFMLIVDCPVKASSCVVITSDPLSTWPSTTQVHQHRAHLAREQPTALPSCSPCSVGRVQGMHLFDRRDQHRSSRTRSRLLRRPQPHVDHDKRLQVVVCAAAAGRCRILAKGCAASGRTNRGVGACIRPEPDRMRMRRHFGR